MNEEETRAEYIDPKIKETGSFGFYRHVPSGRWLQNDKCKEE